MPESTWYDDHQNLADVAQQMLDTGDDAEQIVYMLAKPWKYHDEWAKVQARRAGEAAALEDSRVLTD